MNKNSDAGFCIVCKRRQLRFIYEGAKIMCLLYSILFGGNCGCHRNSGCYENNFVRSGGCGCGSSSVRSGGCGCNGSESAYSGGWNCESNSSYCGNNASAQNLCASAGCCNSCNRCCSGYGRHGGDCVCGDVCYYCRQYALCRCCNRCGN